MSQEKKGLSAKAYQKIDGETYEPYVPKHTIVPEFTVRSILLGAILGIIFAAANAYLGLKVGMTITASIPVAVISMGILRGIMKTGTILENNMVQTVGSAGESLAAGIVFTVPALILMQMTPSLFTIFLISCLGGLLGILMMIPLRKYLIVKEHGNLPYPEGTGCAEVLVAGEEGGSKVEKVMAGLGIGAIYKFLMDKNLFGLWSETPETHIPGYKGAVIGIDALPALLGVGFIIGPRIAGIMLAGGALSWVVLIPLISAVGEQLSAPIFPATELISELGAWGIWNQYIRYVGAGAVAFGGILSLIRAIPTIIQSFKAGFAQMLKKKKTAEEDRTQQDLPLSVVIIGSIVIALLIWILPQLNINLVGAILMVIFAFFFVTVASRVVGLIGGSSLPVSGMTIGALLATSLVFLAFGWKGAPAKFAAISVGAIVCVAISNAADISQDLKTGFLVGATPKRQQIGEVFGVLASSLIIGAVVILLHKSFVIGSETLPAPQATLMKLVVEGVIDQNLPWNFVLVGVFIALCVELLGVPSLPFSVGLYLPITLSTPIIVGGLLRWFVENRNKDEALKEKRENGVLFGSGLIAGEATIGVLIALFVYMKTKISVLDKIPAPIIGHAWTTEAGSMLISLIMFGILTAIFWKIANKVQTDSVK